MAPQELSRRLATVITHVGKWSFPPLRFINGGGGVVSGAGLLTALARSPGAAPCVGNGGVRAGRLGLAAAGGGQCRAFPGSSTPGGAGAGGGRCPRQAGA